MEINNQHNQQKFIFLIGIVLPESFIAACKKEHINDYTKVVFIFPGNPGHHGDAHNLFSSKSGGGLAMAAFHLGQQGIPTLSLPTTGMPQLKANEPMPKLAVSAIADLWRAIGFGMHLALPVRKRDKVEIRNSKPQQYFPVGYFFVHGLDKDDGSGVEPSFWGGVQNNPNQPLADYYSQQLKILRQFMQNPATNKEVPKEFRSNYHEGLVAKQKVKNGEKPDQWFLA